MIGQSVLFECLKSPIIKEILIVGRKSCGIKNSKINEIIHNDFLDYSKIDTDFIGYDACFYCLGVSSVGMPNEKYYNITFDYTVTIAEVLSSTTPNIRFGFISGAGTDETETSKTYWARTKGKAENILKTYSFKSLSIFRPAYIKALNEVKPSYTLNKYFDWLLYPLLKNIFPKYVITSEEMGKGMINSLFQKEKILILESSDIKQLAYLIGKEDEI